MRRLSRSLGFLPLFAAAACSLNPQIDPPGDTANKTGRDAGGTPVTGNGGAGPIVSSGGATTGAGGFPSSGTGGSTAYGGTAGSSDGGNVVQDAAAPDGSAPDSGPGDSGHDGTGGTPISDAGPRKDAQKD